MYVLSEELFPICFAKLLNEFVFSEELFPISFAKSLNELRSYFPLALLNYLMELVPISFGTLLNGGISY